MTGDVAVATEPAPVAVGARRYRGRWYGFPLWLAVGSVGILYDASNPGFPTGYSLPGLVIWTWIAAAWVVRCAQWVRGTSALRSVLVPPLVAATLIAVCAANLPLTLRFAASRSAFDAAVPVVAISTEATDGSGRIGSYDICDVRTIGPATVFIDCPGARVLGYAGFAYVPPGETIDLDDGVLVSPAYTDLGGGWWAWTANW